MPTFSLTLEKTYYDKGFFNVPVAFDRYVRPNDGPIELILGAGATIIIGKVYRTANQNGTARIWGGAKLRNWFQANFPQGGIVAVHSLSPATLSLN